MSGDQIGYKCVDCKFEWGTQTASCPDCGSTRVGRLFGKSFSRVVHPTATTEAVADNPRGDVETIQYLSPSGGRSDTTLSADQVELTLRPPIDMGREGEASVAERVLQQLRRDGRQVSSVPHSDDQGEDRQIICDGHTVSLQIVAVPSATQFLREASRGSASTTVSIDGAVQWVAHAIAKKQAKYASSDRANMLLALDARAAGVLVSTPVTTALAAKYGDICQRTGFGAIWILGPSASRCTRLPSSRW
jgi:hypothetical protein